MKNYNYTSFIKTVVIILLLGFSVLCPNNGFAQNSPQNAIEFDLNDTILSLTPTQDTVWVKFTMDNTYNHLISCIESLTNIDSITLYSGQPNNLTRINISTDQIVDLSSLTTSNTYYLCFRLQENTTSPLTIRAKNIVIIPRFDVDKKEICAGESITFTDLTSIVGSAQCSGLIFYWDYDGAIPNESFTYPGTNIPPFTRVFPNPGNYTITLTIVGNVNGSTITLSYSMNITVHSTDPISFSHQFLTPLICGNDICISDISSNIKDIWNFMGIPSGIVWDLIDLNNSVIIMTKSSNPGMTVNFGLLPVGNYKLVITTHGYCNNDQEFIVYFTISPGVPEIQSVNTSCTGQEISFIGNAPCPDFWHWNFGDGNSSTLGSTVSHIYLNPGTYSVSLQTNNGGPAVLKTITIGSPAKPEILGFNNNCSNDERINYSIGNILANATYNWTCINLNGTQNLGTGTSKDITWGNSIPAVPDYAIVKVQITDEFGCIAENELRVFQCCNLAENTIELNNATINSPVIYNGVKAIINGTLTINSNVTFTDDINNNISSVVLFGPEAKIIVKNGATLKFLNSSILDHNCRYMWDGIYVTEGSTIVIDNSSLLNSINGVVSKDATVIELTNSHFYNNYKSVQIFYPENVIYSVDYAGVITNCTFETNPITPIPTSNIDYLLLLPPCANQQAETAIYAKNVYGLKIGSPSVAANQFVKLKNGITLENSKAVIQNNSFKYIRNLTYNPSRLAFDAAIKANGLMSKPTQYLKQLFIGVGPNVSENNIFENCQTGINVNNYFAEINYNEFKIVNDGIRITNFADVSDYTMLFSKISNNKFYDVTNGIHASLTDIQTRGLLISSNEMYGLNTTHSTSIRKGIEVINVSSLGNVVVNYNKIRLSGSKTAQTFGIVAQNCNGIKIHTNSIERGGASPAIISTDYSYTKGIWISNSLMATVTNNCIYGMGQGIFTSGDLQKTSFTCNEIASYKYAFGFGPYSALSDQGIYGLSSSLKSFNPHNKCNSLFVNGSMHLSNETPNNIILAYSNPVKWYYGQAFNAPGSPYIVNDVFFNTVTIIDGIENLSSNTLCVPTACSNLGWGSGSLTGEIDLLNDPELDGELREDLLQTLLDGQNYSDLNNEFRAYESDFLYNLLTDNSTLIWLGDITDAEYESFLLEQKNDYIGLFADVYRYIDERNYGQAKALNSSIVVDQDNLIFSNLKIVLGIYLDSWCNDRYELTEEEYLVLLDIATQMPYIGGKAVYQARLMLGYNVEDHEEVGYRIQKPANQINENTIRLFPNPASDKVSIEFENNGSMVNGQLKIYGLTGTLLFETEFITSNSTYEVPVTNLLNGIYMFECKINDGSIKYGKLIILK